jgi:hypothetical protein
MKNLMIRILDETFWIRNTDSMAAWIWFRILIADPDTGGLKRAKMKEKTSPKDR